MIQVTDNQEQLQELIPQRVGFRRFAIEDGIMKLNGKRIVFKGVDRHEFSSRRGRVPNHDELLRDIVTMKRNNINAIRTSHYPNDSALYALCDEYGLYLIDECNMETHGMWDMVGRGVWPIEKALPGDDRNGRTYCLTVIIPCIRETRIIQASSSGPAVTNPLAVLLSMKCPSFSMH